MLDSQYMYACMYVCMYVCMYEECGVFPYPLPGFLLVQVVTVISMEH